MRAFAGTEIGKDESDKEAAAEMNMSPEDKAKAASAKDDNSEKSPK